MTANDNQVGGDHYKKRKIQPWDFAEANELSPVQFLVLRYMLRYKDKDGLKDLDKLAHCVEKLKELWIEEHGKD